MTASKGQRLKWLDELTEIVSAGEKAKEQAADLARGLIAEGVPVTEIAEHAPYSAAWLRNERAGMERRGEAPRRPQKIARRRK